MTCIIHPKCSEINIYLLVLRTLRTSVSHQTNTFQQLLRFAITKNSLPLPLHIMSLCVCVCTQRSPSGWQTPADYSTAGWLEWIVYRGHSIGEQKHAKAKRSHVQRAGISLSTMTQKPLNLFNTHRLQPERVLCSSQELSTAKYLLCCSAPHSPIPFSAKWRFFSHGSGLSSWTDSFQTSVNILHNHRPLIHNWKYELFKSPLLQNVF